MTNLPIATRVKNGAALLDREVPGWHNMIDLSTLEMSSCTHCVLGQTFGRENEEKLNQIVKDSGRWSAVKKNYNNSLHRGLAYLTPSRRDNSTSEVFGYDEELKCLWANEIAERRAAEEVEAEAVVTNSTSNNNQSGATE